MYIPATQMTRVLGWKRPCFEGFTGLPSKNGGHSDSRYIFKECYLLHSAEIHPGIFQGV